MIFFEYTNPKMIVSDKGKYIRQKDDVYIAEYINEDGEVVPEHFPYYSTTIFVPNDFTESKMYEQYVEEDINN